MNEINLIREPNGGVTISNATETTRKQAEALAEYLSLHNWKFATILRNGVVIWGK